MLYLFIYLFYNGIFIYFTVLGPVTLQKQLGKCKGPGSDPSVMISCFDFCVAECANGKS